jgi:FkbH-like protein
MTETELVRALRYPIDADAILRRRKAIRRELLGRQTKRVSKRIAILGGSTTFDVRDIVDLFLLDAGIRAEFYECAYARYYETAVFGDAGLDAFRPDVVYVHTTSHNVSAFPELTDGPEAARERVASEVARLTQVWRGLRDRFACTILQNNFEPPACRRLGSLDGVDHRGKGWFVDAVNVALGEAARSVPSVYVHDLHYLASWYGLSRWHDPSIWYSAKYALAYDAIPHLARSVVSLLLAASGLAKKCLVVDLDNTLWGGVIGDDGPEGIQLGQGSPVGEAHVALQEYVRDLGRRGVALAICSKNDPALAEEGFSHPDSVLKLGDFAARKVNWEPKDANIQEIADELSLGTDSFVFLDDNPVERDLVAKGCPDVTVPDVGSDVARYVDALDQGGWFDAVAIADEDLARGGMYQSNAQRSTLEREAPNQDDFLRSLEMIAEIGPFKPLYFDRITQLINKTNQFNLTTRRHNLAEVEAFATDPKYVTLYARLRDRFGDNGLISVFVGEQRQAELHIDTWLMSCRVLKRGLEQAVFDAVVEDCKRRGISEIVGYYYPTKKNALVRDLLESLGFSMVSADETGSVWRLAVPGAAEPKNRFIKVNP